MYRALHTSRTGMKAYQDKLDVVSNNISNLQTDGYKRLDSEFVGLLKDSIKRNGTDETVNPETDMSLGTGIRIGDAYRVLEQGKLLEDENPLALAISGDGFFGLEDGSGRLLLTRNGQFRVSSDGNLVNDDGFSVSIRKGKSLKGFAPEQIEVTESGEVISIDEEGERKSMGSLKLYGVYAQEDLIDAGNGMFYADEKDLISIEIDENGGTAVKQGYVEKSNVDIGNEMVDMMISQRAYQMNAKAVQAADDMWSMINNIKR